MSQPIFTLNARGNVMLEVIQSYFGLDGHQMLREINVSFSAMLEILAAKKIDYGSLKHALVPCPDRNEAAFVFDSTSIESNWYRLEVFKRIIPALDQNATHSILCGDLSGENNLQDSLYEAFSREVIPVRSCTWRHSTQFFVVYINNLSNKMLLSILNSLMPYEAFIGWVDCYAPSFLKTYLSLILCNCFLKAKRIIIQGHEDDRDNSEDVNMVGYPFEEFGYKCKSFQSMYEDLFLSYKIERGVYSGFESDTLFSLNAISSTVVPLDECEVEVEEDKLKYLYKEKEGSMKKSGLLSVAREELEAKIRERINSSYIFNMEYLAQHKVMKFNTVLNFSSQNALKPSKLTVSLEYKPAEKRIRLITMF